MDIESPKKTIELRDFDFTFLGGATDITLYPEDTIIGAADGFDITIEPRKKPFRRKEQITIFTRNLLYMSARVRTVEVEDVKEPDAHVIQQSE